MGFENVVPLEEGFEALMAEGFLRQLMTEHRFKLSLGLFVPPRTQAKVAKLDFHHPRQTTNFHDRDQTQPPWRLPL